MTKPMKLKICTANQAKIKQALDQVQARMHARTVDFDDLARMAQLGEARIEAARKVVRRIIHAPIEGFFGTRYDYCQGGASAKSYHYSRASTRVRIERHRGGWYLTDIDRKQFWPQQGKADHVTLKLPDDYQQLRHEAWRAEHPRYLDEWLTQRGGPDTLPTVAEIERVGHEIRDLPQMQQQLQREAMQRLSPAAVEKGGRRNPSLIQYVDEPEEWLQRLAIRKDPVWLTHIEKPTDWVRWEAAVLMAGPGRSSERDKQWRKDHPDYCHAYETACALAPSLIDLERLEIAYALLHTEAAPEPAESLPGDVLSEIEAVSWTL